MQRNIVEFHPNREGLRQDEVRRSDVVFCHRALKRYRERGPHLPPLYLHPIPHGFSSLLKTASITKPHTESRSVKVLPRQKVSDCYAGLNNGPRRAVHNVPPGGLTMKGPLDHVSRFTHYAFIGYLHYPQGHTYH